MDRRTYLKSTFGLGAAILMPAGVMALAGRTGHTATASDSAALVHIGGSTMGTRYNIRLAGTATPPLRTAIDTALADTDARMSTYKRTSELSQLNTSMPGTWQTLSDESFRVVRTAMSVRQSSRGAFDPSVGALVNVWGFGSTGNVSAAPSMREIAARLDGVGAFDLDVENHRVRRTHRATALDLSGIAKGNGVDRVAAVLDGAGVQDFLVEVGGELFARGRKPDQTSWRVAIERPDPGKREVFRVIELRDKAIATSGDYRNFFLDGGQRFSHTIDPRTGRPVTHQLASVSVLADSTLDADALSTAMMVMGPDDADRFAREHGIAAHFILKSGNKLEESWTPAFESFIAG